MVGRTTSTGPRILLGDVFDRFAKLKFLCIGDSILDVYIDCINTKLAPESTALSVKEERAIVRAGGAANVSTNLARLGVQALLLSPRGADAEAEQLRMRLLEAGVEAPMFLGRAPTTRKIRYSLEGQRIVRVDRDGMMGSKDPALTQIANFLSTDLGRVDAILLSDYGKGCLSSEVLAATHNYMRCFAIPVFVDPKGNDWKRYGPVDLIKPNLAELRDFTGLPVGSDAEVERAIAVAFDGCEARAILVTRSSRGATLAVRGEEVCHLGARAFEVADTCGAGDTNLAVFACARVSGCDWEEAADLAQVASAIAVKHRGTISITIDELKGGVGLTAGKLTSLSEARSLCASWQGQGLNVGFTNGCFDIVHAGHIHSLSQARAVCDRLVVGLNSDLSVTRLKGAGRPINCEHDRASVLSALASVDAVVIFDDTTPESLIAALRPDLLFKGADYSIDSIAGASFVLGRGGRVISLPLLHGRSSSIILKKLLTQDL